MQPGVTGRGLERFQSRLGERLSDKVIAALRNELGGHARKAA